MNYDTHTGVLAAIQRQHPVREPIGAVCGSGFQRRRGGFGQHPRACTSTAIVGVGIYAYLASRQVVRQREFETIAVRNQMLLQVTMAYSELLRAEGRRAAQIQARDEARVIAKLTADYAKAGQGRDRRRQPSRDPAGPPRGRIQAAEAEILTASARLCQLLNLDPSIRLHPTDAAVVPQPIVPDPDPAERADRAGPAPPARAGRPARGDRGGAPGRWTGCKILPFSPNFTRGLQRRRLRRRQQPGPADLRRIQRPRRPRRHRLLDDPEPRRSATSP